MTQHHISDVEHEIRNAEKVDDLSAIFWACREAEAVAGLIAISLDDLIEKHDADLSVQNRLRDIERSADLIRKRLHAVTNAVDHAEMKIRTKLKEIPAQVAELSRVAEVMQAAESAGRRGKR